MQAFFMKEREMQPKLTNKSSHRAPRETPCSNPFKVNVCIILFISHSKEKILKLKF